jgi:hypothetical protein
MYTYVDTKNITHVVINYTASYISHNNYRIDYGSADHPFPIFFQVEIFDDKQTSLYLQKFGGFILKCNDNNIRRSYIDTYYPPALFNLAASVAVRISATFIKC